MTENNTRMKVIENAAAELTEVVEKIDPDNVCCTKKVKIVIISSITFLTSVLGIFFGLYYGLKTPE